MDERALGEWEVYKLVNTENGAEIELDGKTNSMIIALTEDFKCVAKAVINGSPVENEFLWTADETAAGGKDKVLIYAEGKNPMIFELNENTILDGKTVAHVKKHNDVPALKHGDINGDGKINPVDASLILVKFAELSASDSEKPSDEVVQKYDINGDGRITAVDASLILAYCASLAEDETLTLDVFLADKLNK